MCEIYINKKNETVKLLHISDTHGKHRLLQNLPEADIIVHSGDLSEGGTESEILDFLEWFVDLPYKYKIFVAGNHDHGLHNANIEGLPENCYHLSNFGVTIEGVKFYGVPLFMEDIEAGVFDENIRKIPADTDVLITHQPPYGILDSVETAHFGDRILLETILKIKPKYHLFGHAHDAFGIEKSNHTTFVNGALLDFHCEMKYEPVLLDVCI